MTNKNNVMQQGGNFDWSAFEDGWNGSNLKKNNKVKTPKNGDRIKVYSHEKYAQDLVDAYLNKTLVVTPKDDIKNSIGESKNIKCVDVAFSSHGFLNDMDKELSNDVFTTVNKFI